MWGAAQLRRHGNLDVRNAPCGSRHFVWFIKMRSTLSRFNRFYRMSSTAQYGRNTSLVHAGNVSSNPLAALQCQIGVHPLLPARSWCDTWSVYVHRMRLSAASVYDCVREACASRNSWSTHPGAGCCGNVLRERFDFVTNPELTALHYLCRTPTRKLARWLCLFRCLQRMHNLLLVFHPGRTTICPTARASSIAEAAIPQGTRSRLPLLQQRKASTA